MRKGQPRNLIGVGSGTQEGQLLALSRSRTPPTLPEKGSEGVEVGESLPARLIEEPDQNTRRGQGVSVSPVAIRDVDPEVPRNRVEIPAP